MDRCPFGSIVIDGGIIHFSTPAINFFSRVAMINEQDHDKIMNSYYKKMVSSTMYYVFLDGIL